MNDKVNLQNVQASNELLRISTSDIPVSYDNLLATAASLSFNSFPELTFKMQSFSMPEIAIGTVDMPSRYVDNNLVGEKMKFSPYQISFMVDKDMRNFVSMFNWMKAITVQGSTVNKESDAVLMINGEDTFRFVGCWPMRLGGISFTNTDQTGQNVVVDLVINYDYIDYVGKYKNRDSTYIKSSFN